MERMLAHLGNSPSARRTLTAMAVLLVAAAVVLLGFPVYTDIVHNDLQTHLRSQLVSPSILRAYRAGTVAEGSSLTRISIPRIGVDVIVVQGIGDSALQAGAGHYPSTPLPCASGDVAIAGHRTTFGKPFANIDLLAPGDTVTLRTPVGACVYRVARAPFVVPANDFAVVADTPGVATLTLTSCHPKGSAVSRIVIKATMVSSVTFGSA